MNHLIPGGRYPETMDAHLTLATTASLIADPARSAILLALLDGRAVAAGELARRAGISAPIGQHAPGQLLQGGFVEVASQGRRRYYRIASPEVAHAIEALGVISSPRKRQPIGESESIRYARTCYDHLAGELGVALADFLQRRELILPSTEREYAVTEDGEVFLSQWSIDVAALRGARRVLARRCSRLDGTPRSRGRRSRRGHLQANAQFTVASWPECDRGSRVVHVTATGSRN